MEAQSHVDLDKIGGLSYGDLKQAELSYALRKRVARLEAAEKSRREAGPAAWTDPHPQRKNKDTIKAEHLFGPLATLEEQRFLKRMEHAVSSEPPPTRFRPVGELRSNADLG